MKGIIYEIFRPVEPNTVYIGSSLKSKNKRMREHKEDYKRYLNGNHNYVSSYELVKYPDAIIKVIATVEVESKQELRKHEDKYLLKFKNDPNYKVVNMIRAFKTEEEKRQDRINYYNTHKEEITQKNNLYQRAQ